MPVLEQDKYALFVAASCIAAVRTFQQRIAEHEWKTIDTVDDSVRLAKMVLRRIEDDRERQMRRP